MAKSKLPAGVKEIGFCNCCNKEVIVGEQGHHYSKTKRGTINYFHEECAKLYMPIVGPNWFKH